MLTAPAKCVVGMKEILTAYPIQSEEWEGRLSLTGRWAHFRRPRKPARYCARIDSIGAAETCELLGRASRLEERGAIGAL